CTRAANGRHLGVLGTRLTRRVTEAGSWGAPSLRPRRTDDRRLVARLPCRSAWGIGRGRHPWRAGNEDGNDSGAADPRRKGPRRSTWRIRRASPDWESARPRGAPAYRDDTAHQISPGLARFRRYARDT